MAKNNKITEVFLDLNEGLLGSWETQFVDEGSQHSKVNIKFFPFNDWWRRKAAQLKSPVSKSNIITVSTIEDGSEGKPHIFYVHYDPTSPSIFKEVMASLYNKNLNILNNEIKQLKAENGALKSKMHVLSSGGASAVAESRKILQSGNNSSSNGLENGGLPPRFPFVNQTEW